MPEQNLVGSYEEGKLLHTNPPGDSEREPTADEEEEGEATTGPTTFTPVRFTDTPVGPPSTKENLLPSFPEPRPANVLLRSAEKASNADGFSSC